MDADDEGCAVDDRKDVEPASKRARAGPYDKEAYTQGEGKRAAEQYETEADDMTACKRMRIQGAPRETRGM